MKHLGSVVWINYVSDIKRENVVSYFSDKDAPIFLIRKYKPIELVYESAKTRLAEIKNDLLKINRSAANSF